MSRPIHHMEIQEMLSSKMFTIFQTIQNIYLCEYLSFTTHQNQHLSVPRKYLECSSIHCLKNSPFIGVGKNFILHIKKLNIGDLIYKNRIMT